MRWAPVVLLVGLTACSGGKGPDMTGTALTYDLTAPPTRGELGFEAGKRALVLGRDGGELRSVVITLPGGEQLRTDRAFRLDASAFGTDGPPESLYVYTRQPDVAAAEQVLRDPVVDLPEAEVARGLALLGSTGSSTGSATVSRVLDLKAPAQGYLTVGVGVSRDVDQEDVTVVFQLFWAEAVRGVEAP